jgi:hypothetical protein
MEWEERYLVNLVIDMAPVFDGWTDDFYDAVANRINECYGHTRIYVPLYGAKVKYKIKESTYLFGKADKEVFAPLLLVLCPTTDRSLFILFVNLN